ncbi:MAG: DUF3098 domain-containing protein [Clostridium sp.]|nr:DUF3098 domain-containing protein [Clostridium sp.]
MQQNKKDSHTTAYSQPKGAQAQKDTADELPLGKKNFIIMGISLLLIIIGFALTSGSPSGLEEYNPDIFSARRIIVGPALCFVGFVLMAIAIIVKPKGK